MWAFSDIEKRQRRFAAMLQEKFGGLNRNTVIVLFLLYVTFYVTACVYIGVTALENRSAFIPASFDYKKADSVHRLQKTTSLHPTSTIK